MSTKFRKGDIVTIEATVEGDPFMEDEVKVTIEGAWSGGPSTYVKVDRLTMKQPSFEIGDEVTGPYPTGAQKRATILAMSEDWVWVKTDAGYETWAKDRVTRVDPELKAEPEAEQVEAA